MVFTDASHGRKDEPLPQVGYTAFTVFKKVAHAIASNSHKARRIFHSEVAVEKLAAADAFDDAYFLCNIDPCCKWPLKLVTNSIALTALATPTHKPREKRVKLDLHAIYEAQERKELD